MREAWCLYLEVPFCRLDVTVFFLTSAIDFWDELGVTVFWPPLIFGLCPLRELHFLQAPNGIYMQVPCGRIVLFIAAMWTQNVIVLFIAALERLAHVPDSTHVMRTKLCVAYLCLAVLQTSLPIPADV